MTSRLFLRMPPCTQVLAVSTTSSRYKPKEWPSTVKPLIAPDFPFVQLHIAPPQEESMAQNSRACGRSSTEDELWFNLPNPTRPKDQSCSVETSAYQATKTRSLPCPTSLEISPHRLRTPSSSANVNKPLPPLPMPVLMSAEETKSSKTPSLRERLNRKSGKPSDATCLQPEKSRSTLSVNTLNYHQYNYSRSMPNSPFDSDQTFLLVDIPTLPRVSSASGAYPEQNLYRAYSNQAQQQALVAPPFRAVRSTSMATYFDSSASPRSNTSPETTSLDPSLAAVRESLSNKAQPHTWLPRSEPFADISDFSLFAQAMTGLPEDSNPFVTNGSLQLQGSLFARRTQNDTIPLPQQNSNSSAPRPVPSFQRTFWQNYTEPHTSPLRLELAMTPDSTLPSPEAHQQREPPVPMCGLNLELEMLGLDGDHAPDDELPNYVQSQAEMHAKKREEASARARELESRWRGARR